MSDLAVNVCALAFCAAFAASVVAAGWRAWRRSKAAFAVLEVQHRHVRELWVMAGRSDQIRRAAEILPREHAVAMYDDLAPRRAEMRARHDEELRVVESIYRSYGGSAVPK